MKSLVIRLFPKRNPPLPRVQTKACGFMRMTPAEMLRVSLAVASTLAGSAVFNAVAAEVAACSLRLKIARRYPKCTPKETSLFGERS